MHYLTKFDAFIIGCAAAAVIYMTESSHADVFPVPVDDAAHLLGSFAIASTAAPLFVDTEHPIAYPFLVSYTAGTVKEIADMRKTGNPLDKHDMAVNALGAAVGAVTGNAVYMFAVNKGIGLGVRGKFVTSKPEGAE